jgi:hypothetical protein
VEGFSMKMLRLFSPFLLVFIINVATPLYLYSLDTVASPVPIGCRNFWSAAYNRTDFSPFHFRSDGIEFFEDFAADTRMTVVKTPTDGGIKEAIPDKYKDRFEKWKAELRSTEFGRQQWDTYANNKKFILTVTISDKRGKGAGTDKYLWDGDGNFVGATITLGDDLNEGYPDPIYYPVMNSLSSDETYYSISGKILAAAKMSHEIGHVNQTASANKSFLELQNKLMPEYTSIFLKNGRDTNDKKLVDLAEQMGGTPIEIWESREYWSEVNAMLFLKERISKEDFYCFVFNKIKRNIETYAKDYGQRFDQHSEFADSPCWK